MIMILENAMKLAMSFFLQFKTYLFNESGNCRSVVIKILPCGNNTFSNEKRSSLVIPDLLMS